MDDGFLIRNMYLDRLEDLTGDRRAVKVLTGLRGVGKSTIMDQFIQRMIDNGKNPDDIIRFDFDSVDLFDIRYAEDLKILVTKSVEGKTDPFVIMDEVQKIPGWSEALWALMQQNFAEYFLTSSDDSVTAPRKTDLKPCLREIRVMPLSIYEFMDLNEIENSDEAVDLYMEYGGLPCVRTSMSEREAHMLLYGALCSSVLQDALTYSSRLDPDTAVIMAERIMDTSGTPMDSDEVMSMSGKKFGYTSRALDSLVGTYLVMENEGRSYINKLKKSQMIYYAADLGIRNSIKGVTRNVQSETENAVFIELKRRGCKVKVEDYDGYVSFVADYGDGKVRYVVSDMELTAPEPPKKSFFGKVKEALTETVRISIDGSSGKNHVTFKEFLLGHEPKKG
ncbi:putative ATPase (AAA+ superfamily) [Thermoplasmatales archaeon BRNA1]|nr:putative ATPase (AAA+ superfamily) [Thermoplasmatales archaeon BRNA1]